MSQRITLARPYARAAFARARELGALPEWSAWLAASSAIAADPQVAAALANPAVGSARQAALVAAPGQDGDFARLIDVLAQNRRLALLAEITALFDGLRAEAEDVVRARITSAEPLAADELDRIVASLRRRFGREVEARAEVDPALIGGAVVDTGDMVIDGSLRTKLARLGAMLAH